MFSFAHTQITKVFILKVWVVIKLWGATLKVQKSFKYKGCNFLIHMSCIHVYAKVYVYMQKNSHIFNSLCIRLQGWVKPGGKLTTENGTVHVYSLKALIITSFKTLQLTPCMILYMCICTCFKMAQKISNRSLCLILLFRLGGLGRNQCRKYKFILSSCCRIRSLCYAIVSVHMLNIEWSGLHVHVLRLTFKLQELNSHL